jgi:hypothetical protein
MFDIKTYYRPKFLNKLIAGILRISRFIYFLFVANFMFTE